MFSIDLEIFGFHFELIFDLYFLFEVFKFDKAFVLEFFDLFVKAGSDLNKLGFSLFENVLLGGFSTLFVNPHDEVFGEVDNGSEGLGRNI